MKSCRQCGIDKPLSDYYDTLAGALGKTSKCKECLKANAKTHRDNNIEKCREADRARSKNPDRVAAREAYAKTVNGIEAARRAKTAYHERNRKVINERNRIEHASPEAVDRRRAIGRAYMASEKGKESQKKTNAKHPDRRAARIATSNAIRDGRLLPWPVCSMPECSAKPVAHHPDYSRPLDVVWLCQSHHKQAHALIKDHSDHEKTPLAS